MPTGEMEINASSPVVKLDSQTSTLFRRGQIITRVIDVVRELTDNAIDSGSTRVQILLDNYGLNKIEVRDDGHGIPADHLRSAISGGYSSKLENTSHLSCGEEYGFRGEALSSICSFANVTIITKTEKDPCAKKYVLDMLGQVVGESRVGNGRGTTVIVTDLFVKFPVRRNYIREKPRMVNELKDIENYCKAMGLSNPPVHLSLVHNGSSIWSKPIVKTTEQALAAVFGIQISRQLSKCGPVEISFPNQSPNHVTTVECYVPKVPIDTKLMTLSSNKMCVIIVNRRRVQLSKIEKKLQQYILGAIQKPNQPNKTTYPVSLVKIDLPSTLVDFNRDLNKSKVFLEHENEIIDELEGMLMAFYADDFNTKEKENLREDPPYPPKFPEAGEPLIRPREQNISPEPNSFSSRNPPVSSGMLEPGIKIPETGGTLICIPQGRDPPSKRAKFSNSSSRSTSVDGSRAPEKPRVPLISEKPFTPASKIAESNQTARTERSARQVTLDSLLSWNTWSDINISQLKKSVPAPPPVLSQSQTTYTQDKEDSLMDSSQDPTEPDHRVNWSRGADNISDFLWSSESCTGINPNPFPLMPLPMPKFPKPNEISTRGIPENQILPVEEDLFLLSRTVSSDCILKNRDSAVCSNAQPKTALRYPPLRVIGELGKQGIYAVKIDSLIGAFCPENMLKMSEPLRDKLGLEIHTETFDMKTVELLLEEFTKLSTDDFSEEMVSRIFTLLKDLED